MPKDEATNEEQSQARELGKAKRAAKAIKQKAIGGLKPGSPEAIARLRKIYRLINAFSAASLVGLVITFLVMNGQFLLGNILKNKWVPPLTTIEIILMGLFDIIVLASAMTLIVIFYFIISPWETVKAILGETAARLINLNAP